MYLVYNGIVNIKLKIKDKVINISTHNAGEATLFQAISMALAGYDIKQYLPSSISFFEEDVQKLKQPVPIIGLAYSNDISNESRKWYTVFNATIPYELFDSPQPSANYTVKLFDASNNVLATINNVKLVDGFSKGEELVIEWKMYVNNPQDEQV